MHDFFKPIRIRSYATIANLVCGFDILGLCLSEPFDEMEVQLLPEPKVIIESCDGFCLPPEPELNTAGLPLLEVMKEWKQEIGFHLRIQKQIKPGSGLGSSAASSV